MPKTTIAGVAIDKPLEDVMQQYLRLYGRPKPEDPTKKFWEEEEAALQPQYKDEIIEGTGEAGEPSFTQGSRTVTRPARDLSDPNTLTGMILRAKRAGVQKVGDLVSLRGQIAAERREAEKAKVPKSKGSFEHAAYLRPIIEQYGGQWSDDEDIMGNYNRTLRSLDGPQRQEFFGKVRGIFEKPEKPELTPEAASKRLLKLDKDIVNLEAALSKDEAANTLEARQAMMRLKNERARLTRFTSPPEAARRPDTIESTKSSPTITREQAIAELKRRGRI